MPEDRTDPENGPDAGPDAGPDQALLTRVRFVLVEPQLAANVGAAARALKNLGFDRLHLVRPRCDHRSAEARSVARDAADLLERVRVFDGLDAALEGAVTVVGTSRRRGKHRKPHWRLDRFRPDLIRLTASGATAAVFGREAHGLYDAELDRCTHLVHFPASAAYPSFNLAQSVLLVAYEFRLAAETTSEREPVEPLADHATREAMFAHLESALRAIGFLHEDTVTPMMRRIRRMLGRASLTTAEAQILRGLARQTLWLARQAGIETTLAPERSEHGP